MTGLVGSDASGRESLGGGATAPAGWLSRIPDVFWRGSGLAYFTFWIYRLYDQHHLWSVPAMFYAEALGPAMICLAYVFRPPARARATGVAEIVVPFVGMSIPMAIQYSAPWGFAVDHVLWFVSLVIPFDIVLALGFLSLWTSFSIVPEARELRTGGMYRFSRHPIYVTQFFVVFLGCLARASLANVLVLALSAYFQHWRAVMEEAKLVAAFPEYAPYAARTPRYLPFSR